LSMEKWYTIPLTSFEIGANKVNVRSGIVDSGTSLLITTYA